MTKWITVLFIGVMVSWASTSRIEAASACSATPELTAAEDAVFGECLFRSRTAFGQDRSGPFASCANCHYGENFRDRASHFDILKNSKNKTAQVLRNTPTLFNTGETAPYGWDGRNTTIQAQALEAILNPLEMAGTGATPAQLDALAAFVKTIRPPESAYDKFIAGDSTALTEEAARGMELFLGKGTCSTCHTPPLFTNNKFRKNQKDATFSGKTDLGAGFVGTAGNLYFNVPQLRGVSLTGPYMHNGALGTLAQVVRFYNQSLSLGLTDQEVQDLLEFLRAL
jgi:cytochrome c peroxidase